MANERTRMSDYCLNCGKLSIELEKLEHKLQTQAGQMHKYYWETHFPVFYDNSLLLELLEAVRVDPNPTPAVRDAVNQFDAREQPNINLVMCPPPIGTL